MLIHMSTVLFNQPFIFKLGNQQIILSTEHSAEYLSQSKHTPKYTTKSDHLSVINDSIFHFPWIILFTLDSILKEYLPIEAAFPVSLSSLYMLISLHYDGSTTQAPSTTFPWSISYINQSPIFTFLDQTLHLMLTPTTNTVPHANSNNKRCNSS